MWGQTFPLDLVSVNPAAGEPLVSTLLSKQIKRTSVFIGHVASAAQKLLLFIYILFRPILLHHLYLKTAAKITSCGGLPGNELKLSTEKEEDEPQKSWDGVATGD